MLMIHVVHLIEQKRHFEKKKDTIQILELAATLLYESGDSCPFLSSGLSEFPLECP